MLTAFRAQAVHELKARDKSKIESLLAFGDRLLVGLNTGSLRIYRVNEQNEEQAGELGDVPPSPTKSRAVELLRDEEKFGKKPVQQLAIVKECNLLVSLSDAVISLHDLQTYMLVERLEQTRGAACFTVVSNVVKDPDTNIPGLVSRLAVGVKRKIMCWVWRDTEQEQDVLEVSLEGSIRSLTWATGTRLVVGMDSGFSILDMKSLELTPVNKTASSRAAAAEGKEGELAGVRFGAVSSTGMGYMGMGSWVPRPMATALSNDQVLLAKDVNTLFCTTSGQALEKRQIPWSNAPDAVGFSYPYLLALQPPEKGTLHVRNPDTLSLLQIIQVPNAIILHVPQPNISLAHAGKGFLVASDRCIWRMNAVPYDPQVIELVEKQRFDEAVSLLTLLEDTLIDDKAGRIREVKILKAEHLFALRKYRDALDLFTDAEAPPERVVKLYPKGIAGEHSGIVNGTDDVGQQQPDAEDGAHLKVPAKEPPSTPQKSMLSKIKGPGHSRKTSDSTSIAGSPRTDSDNVSIRTKKGAADIPALDKPLEGEDLKLATRSLVSCLAQARVQIQKYLSIDGVLRDNPPEMDQETGKPAFANLLPGLVFGSRDFTKTDWQAELLKTAQLVDTTLFRAYMLALPSLAGPLFRLDNFCDPDVVQSSLYENERYGDLIDFLHGKKLHRQALEMLQKFGRGEADRATEIPQSMRGPERTVAYLKQLPPELVDLILEYVKWPIDEKPELGMQVFQADSDNADKLPREQVLHFLEQIDHEKSNGQLEMQYLEHVIDELNDKTADLHQRLIDLYLDALKISTLDDIEKDTTKTKLESFLRRSKAYNKNRTFRQLTADNPLLYESRALVLAAMGNHKQALSIYVFQIKDFIKAEDYCNKMYLEQLKEDQQCLLDAAATHDRPRLEKQLEPEDSADRPNLFATLLGLYLKPPVGEIKRWPQALDLLSRHGSRLPASSTLELMPDDLAVQELQDYFRGRMRHANSLLREERVVHSLEAVRRANTEATLLLGKDVFGDEGLKKAGRNRRVRITEEDHCKVCHKRFGASAVRVYPDNTVVHYGCVGKKASEPGRRSSRGWA